MYRVGKDRRDRVHHEMQKWLANRPDGDATHRFDYLLQDLLRTSLWGLVSNGLLRQLGVTVRAGATPLQLQWTRDRRGGTPPAAAGFRA